MRSRRGLGWLGVVCTACFLLGEAPAAAATTLHVTTTQDPSGTGDCTTTDVSCSLRQAILAAQSGDAISVPAGLYKLSTPSASIDTNVSFSLIGAGARKTTIRQTETGQNFLVISSGDVTIRGVTITGGQSNGGQAGGAITNGGLGTLTLENTFLTHNEATGTGGPFMFVGKGGAIGSEGPVVIRNSTISGNTASAGTGPAATGGGISSVGPVTVVNSTIAGNHADGGSGTGSGGGIYMGADPHASLTLANATIAFNTVAGSTSAQGGNLYLVGSGAGVFVSNSIIARGTGDSGSENCFGASGQVTSQGYNLEDRNQCAFTGIGDRATIPAKLGALGNYGGATNTVALLTGSPAINHGNPSGCTDPSTNPVTAIPTDQRGFHRPQGTRCDIGAFEFRVPVLGGSPRVSGTPKVGDRLTCLLPAVQSQDGQAMNVVTWLRDGTSVGTGTTYVVRGLDKSHRLACRVRATNAAGSVSASSRAVLVSRG